jgi:hypothetical protein
MKRNLNMLALCITLVLVTGAASAQADERDGAVRGSVDVKSPFNQKVKAESYTVNNPKTVLGGASGRMVGQLVQPWWVSRNDARMNIRKDTRPMEVVVYRVYTHDRQSTHGSRVNDSYRRTVRGVRYGQHVR